MNFQNRTARSGDMKFFGNANAFNVTFPSIARGSAEVKKRGNFDFDFLSLPFDFLKKILAYMLNHCQGISRNFSDFSGLSPSLCQPISKSRAALSAQRPTIILYIG